MSAQMLDVLREVWKKLANKIDRKQRRLIRRNLKNQRRNLKNQRQGLQNSFKEYDIKTRALQAKVDNLKANVKIVAYTLLKKSRKKKLEDYKPEEMEDSKDLMMKIE